MIALQNAGRYVLSKIPWFRLRDIITKSTRAEQLVLDLYAGAFKTEQECTTLSEHGRVLGREFDPICFNAFVSPSKKAIERKFLNSKSDFKESTEMVGDTRRYDDNLSDKCEGRWKFFAMHLLDRFLWKTFWALFWISGGQVSKCRVVLDGLAAESTYVVSK